MVRANERAALLRSLPAPEPVGGQRAYLQERELALAADARKRANYEAFLHAHRAAAVAYLPIKLDIENVSRCNFKCTMCIVPQWPKGRRARDMRLEEFKRLIDEQHGLVEIKLQGVGEPLLQGDAVFEMIRYARARHIWVRTTTNASLLHLRDNYRKLIDSGVNEVQISIDGATPEVYESIRVGAVFKRVIENCRAVNAYCRSLGMERTKMWTVVQSANLGQLEAIVELAADLGFPHQVFSLELGDWASPDMRAHNKRLDVESMLDPARLLSLVEQGQRRGLRVRFWNVTGKYDAAQANTLCPWPFERAVVSSDLRVVPCCYVGNPDTWQIDAAIGPAGTFSDVWKGAAYSAFRLAHLKGEPPGLCKACYRSGGPQ